MSAGEEVGFYGSEIAVTKADGTLVNDVVNVGVLSQQVAGDSGSTLYAMLTTDEKGNIAGTPELVQGLPSCTRLFGLKRGEGSLYFPIAKLADNPKFRAEKIAMNYNPITLPLIADDASYNPCMEGGNAAK